MNDFAFVWSALFFCGLLLLMAITIRACAMDAKRRGKSPILVSFLVVFFFPLGLLLWLLFRPEPMDRDGYGGKFHLSDHRLQ
jgi:hypothetical protein